MKNRGVYCIFWISVFLVTCDGIARIYYTLTDDFRLANITYDLPYSPEWEVPPLTRSEEKRLDPIFDQTFGYLGKGAQCYAFSSEDEKYVIKFFKFKHHNPDRFFNHLYLFPGLRKYQEERLAKHKRKLESAFIGYKLAYDENRNESGIIKVHLNRTDHVKKRLRVKDKMGWIRFIDLDSTIYVVQKKGKSMQEAIKQALSQNDLALVIDRFSKIFDQYFSEYSRGIYDRDHCIMKNTGFIDKTPIHFDVGKLTKNEQMKERENQKKDLLVVMAKIRQWFTTYHPVVYQEIESLLEGMIEKKAGESSKLTKATF